MKSLYVVLAIGVALASVGFSSSAFAWPVVGDVVKYDISISAHSKVVNGQVVIATTAIDPSKDLLTQDFTFKFPGKTTQKRKVQKLSDVQTEASWVPVIVGNCAHYGGTSENVQTAVGTFYSCKREYKDTNKTGYVWLANVLNGWVKSTSTDSKTGHVTTATLNSFSN